MSKLRNENVTNEIKYTKYSITVQMKSSSILPCISYVVASLSAEPVLLFLILHRTTIMLSLTSKLPSSLNKYCRKVTFTIIFPLPWLLLFLRHVICKLSVLRSTTHMLQHHYQRIHILELINMLKLTAVTFSCAKFCYIFTVTGLI